jgi:hypothetical protein
VPESITTGAGRELGRRNYRRYPVNTPVRYKIKGTVDGLIATGSGQTLDASSGGILFESNNPLKAGVELELAIDWPASAGKSAGLTLWLTGTVVRVEQKRAAVAIAGHAFRARAFPGAPV